MKLIHCADIHLDSPLSANLEGDKKKLRKTELLQTFLRMVDYAEKKQVAAILIAGDLFDTKKVSKTVRNAVYDAIVNHPQLSFFYLRGNHDAESFLRALDTVPDNLKLFSDSWTSYTLEEDGNTLAITGAELFGDNAQSLYSSLVLDNNRMNIVMLHGQEMQYQGKDKTEMINLPALKGKGIDYLALGHIHAYKRAPLDARGVYAYCGCLEGRGFDECGEHGFIELDVDFENKKIVDTFVPFASRNLYTIPVDVSGCESTSEVQQVISKTLAEQKIADIHMVKLVLCGNVSVDSERDISLLTNTCADNFFFVKIYDETKLAVDYEMYTHDESLKGEFVRQVQASGLDEDEKAEIIRTGILALAGEEFV